VSKLNLVFTPKTIQNKPKNKVIFLFLKTISKLISTWLLPLNCLVICFLVVLFYRFELANGKWLWRSDRINRFSPEVFLNFIIWSGII